MRSILIAAVALCAACAQATESTDPLRDQLPAEHQLQLTVTDAIASPGFAYPLPSVSGETGEIRVQHTRYGSLCRYEVTGDAEVEGSRVAVHVRFAERLTICTQEIRALTYQGRVGLSAGSYDVLVIHHEPDTRVDTLVTRTVVVK